MSTNEEVKAAAKRKTDYSGYDYLGDEVVERMKATDNAILSDAYLAGQHQPINAKLLEVAITAREKLAALGWQSGSAWQAGDRMTVRQADENIAAIQSQLDSAIAVARAQIEDDTKPVSEEWLLSIGFIMAKYDGTLWPSIRIPCGQVVQWRAAGMWIGDTPIVLVGNHGDVLDFLRGLHIKQKASD